MENNVEITPTTTAASTHANGMKAVSGCLNTFLLSLTIAADATVKVDEPMIIVMGVATTRPQLLYNLATTLIRTSLPNDDPSPALKLLGFVVILFLQQ